jgi:predicted acyl esterase
LGSGLFLQYPAVCLAVQPDDRTEGLLRASHRRFENPSHDGMGLPRQPGTRASVEPLESGEATELAFDLLPCAWIFPPGHRIRIALTGADRDNAATPEKSPPPRVGIRLGGGLSRILLPTVPPEE